MSFDQAPDDLMPIDKEAYLQWQRETEVEVERDQYKAALESACAHAGPLAPILVRTFLDRLGEKDDPAPAVEPAPVLAIEGESW